MSWDVMLVKTKNNTEPMSDINDINTLAFAKADVSAALKNKFTDIDSDNREWLHYEGGSYAISFNLSTDRIILLHIYILDELDNAVYDTVVNIIFDLCSLFDCRAFDTTTGEFIAV